MEHIIKEILRQVEERADEFAISDEHSSFTNRELIEFAKCFAANLKRDGITRGSRVVIEASRRKEYVGALLGTWLLGAVTIPLTNDYPEERLNYIKQDSKYNILVDDKYIDHIDKSISEEPIIPDLDDEGLVIYTSGSTGNPKGVVHTFRSMSAVAARNTVHDQDQKTKRNNIAGLIAPFTFIVGMSMVLAAMCLGKHLVLAPDEIRKDPFKLAKYYDDNDIQASFVPPRMVEFMIQHNKSLKTISVGSERITNLFFNNNPVLMNGYGSTETFGGVLAFNIDKSYENTPIGKPFGKEKAYVLDDNNNEVEEGELCIAGDVAKCYLNREEESKKVFVPNPFADKDGFPRMFRTRDIVRRLPDGNLLFVERKDWMIKINGQRVEPLEIESTIRRLSGIKQVAIKDFTAKNGVTYLAAYYVSDGKITEEEIKKHCELTLTSYMVPAFFVKMDALPVNPNGKLDRKNLPAPDVANYKREYVAPQTKLEEALCKSFENILKIEKVGTKDDFFSLGGDSIKALEVINELDDLPLDLETIFACKTPTEIAKALENGGENEIEFDRVQKSSYPLTSSQLGVYFPSISNPSNLQYNNPIKIELDKDVDLDKLVPAIEKAINNHNAYKCNISLVDGIPSMVPNNREIKVQRAKSDDLEKSLSAFIKPFDLENDDLCRVTVFESKDRTVIAFDAHHIVFDGTSLAVLLKEIKRAYEGKDLYEEKTSVFDLSTYEEVLKQSDKYAKAKEYYQNIFDGLEISNDFPTDFEDNGESILGNVTTSLSLDKEKLAKFLKSNGITENSLFLTAYSYVLSKFNGSDKSLVSVAESGRHTSMTFNTAGMLVKTIALPMDFEKEADISDCVIHMQNMFKESCKNDAYPFSELANTYGLTNDFMFVFQGDQFANLTIGDKSYPVNGMANPNAISKLSLMVFRNEDGYRLSFSYKSNLFLKEIIESFAETYAQVLNEFIEKETLKDVKLVSKEVEARLETFNDNKMPLEHKTVIDYFDEVTSKNPDMDMVITDEKHIKAKEGVRVINKLAAYIQKLGIKNNDVVSILIPRNEWIFLAAWGAIKAGAAYQPLDPTYPSERLTFMINDAKAKLLITTHELEPLIKDYSGKVLYVDQIEDLKDDEPKDVKVDFEDLVVLLYTSGTTGTPKGVMLCHRNLSTIVQFDKVIFKLDKTSIGACYASNGFDAGMHDNFQYICNGAPVYIIPEEIRLNLVEVDKRITEHKVTNMIMTTQVARQLILMTKSPYLRSIEFGGEKIVPFDATNIPFKCFNIYGPTECSVYSNAQEMHELHLREPIGKGNKNVSTYVVDKDLNRLPVGVPGELLLAGPQVGKGYLNLPEKTEKSFIKNPFNSEKAYEIAYKTGDVVRFLADGNVDFIGRNDGQVKIRGFRIELTEVEGIIREFPTIKDATVQAFDKPSGGKYLAAYLVGDTEINLDELRKFIASRKPAYMVPEAMMQIEKIPLNQNHKVNKRALPAITKSKKKEGSEAAHVDNVIVTKIRAIIKQILNDDSFEYDDNLFDYGMNSLSIIRLSVLLNEQFGVEVDVKDLLNECSIHSIETSIINFLLLNKSEKKEEAHELRDSYPLTRSQIGIYTEYLKDNESVNYNIPVVIKFSKEKYADLTSEKLVDAVRKVCDAHPSIKCTIDSDKDGKFVMVPHHGNEVEIDTQKLSDEEFEKLVKTYVKPHDLSKKLYKFSVISLNNGLALLLDIHHVMFDGASQNIFIGDLLKAIAGEDIQKEKYTMLDVALDEEKDRASEKYNEAKEYYTNLLGVLDGSTEVEKDSFEKEPRFGSCNIVEEAIDVKELNEFVKSNNITLNAFFLTAFSLALSKFTYQNDVCFSTVYNGRNSLDLTKLIGMTVKTLPFVNSLDGNLLIKDLLKANKDQILKSMNNDVYSFSEISRELGFNLNIMFIYQGLIAKESGLDINFMALNDLKCDISIEVRNDDSKLYYHAEFNEAKYSTDLISRLLRLVTLAAKGIMSKEKIDEISYVSESDIEEMKKLNDYDAPFNHRPIAQQFVDMAEKYPDHPCVIFHDVTLTYKQVDEISDKIAAYVSSLGIGRENVVGVLIGRSECMVTCTYGVIKAGAAYQPIDTSYPNERINFMLKDSAAKLLITSHEYREKADEYDGPVLFIEDIEKLEKPMKKPVISTQEHDLMCMLYTSGTTGLPKGVMLENYNFIALADADAKARRIDHNSIEASYASYGFDACTLGLFTELTHGGTLVILDEDIRLDLPRLDAYMTEQKITHISGTTQMMRQLALFTKNPYIKSIQFGGEKITPFYIPDAKFDIINGYGPTECAVYSNHFFMTDVYERVPIGKIHENEKIYILDKNNNRLPVGCIGELAIAGRQVSRGYLNRPEKTASTYIPNKFDNDEGYERLYKTGDVVRLTPSGDVDFIGRNDGQVKIRGFRIELSEVEEVIRRFKGVKNATVAAFDDPSGGKFLAAYVVGDEKINIADLNAFIMNEKPPYMVPKVTMQIDAIPLTVNHKVDKRKLPKPDVSSVQGDYVAPVNDLEKEFCELFGSILGTSRVSATDDFFALGGSSINAAQIVSYAFGKGYDLVYKNVFDNPTPRMLSEFISKSNNVTPTEIVEEPKDFKEIVEPVFANNVSSQLEDLESHDIGNVLLLGSTGFLGTHILRELMDNTNHKVICVVRANEAQNATERLQTILEYYFEKTYEEEYGKRIIIVNGNMLDENIADKVKEYDFKTIINCAAVVKHFAKDDSIEKTNTGGARNLVDLALKLDKTLIHISTLSVSGESVNDSIPVDFKYKETMLDVGQAVENKYIKSKFDAEYEIKEAIKNKGLKAKIIRVGNLMSRSNDGEFQINAGTNNFMNTIKAFKLLGCVPYETLSHNVEFSQIDLVAKAIILLAGTNDKFNVYHVNNVHTIQMNNVIYELNKNGIAVKPVNAQEFGAILNKLLNNESDVRSLNSLLAYRANRNEKRRAVDTDNSFTLNTLYRLGFYWPLPDSEYISKLIEYLASLEFFE